jgi:hypothetical protein
MPKPAVRRRHRSLIIKSAVDTDEYVCPPQIDQERNNHR